jgi:hypothetical protein
MISFLHPKRLKTLGDFGQILERQYAMRSTYI